MSMSNTKKSFVGGAAILAAAGLIGKVIGMFYRVWLTDLISSEGINIEYMNNQSRGAYAYTVLDVGTRPSDELMEKLTNVENHYRVRLLMP